MGTVSKSACVTVPSTPWARRSSRADAAKAGSSSIPATAAPWTVAARSSTRPSPQPRSRRRSPSRMAASDSARSMRSSLEAAQNGHPVRPVPVESSMPQRRTRRVVRRRARGILGSAGQQLVEALIALADAVFHAAGEEGVAAFEAVDQRGRREPGAAVAEVFEHEPLEGDVVGEALEGEGLDDQLRGAHLVEAAVEGEL